MILSKITEYADQFKSHLATGQYHTLYLWQSLETFQTNWDVNHLDFKSMFERSFHNTLENDLWEGHDYFPKRSMLDFIDRDHDLMRNVFKDLYEERLDIEARVDRFLFHCNAIRDDMLRSHPKYRNHYHDNYKMISVYLAFKYPTQYCIYEFSPWQVYMKEVGAHPVPQIHDPGRFFKVMRTTQKLISRDTELLELHLSLRAGDPKSWQGDSLLLAREFYQFVAAQATR